jgi:hypothetical protein
MQYIIAAPVIGLMVVVALVAARTVLRASSFQR